MLDMTVISMGIRCLCLAYPFCKIVTEVKTDYHLIVCWGFCPEHHSRPQVKWTGASGLSQELTESLTFHQAQMFRPDSKEE